ncbi:MAG: hypothetical protein ABFD54_06095 [Armatimonadota bacterium]|nr:hypothetical protein [bacterium]
MLDTDIQTPLSEEERDSLINSIAKKVADRRLETVAVLFLEMHKPLSFLASQAMLVSMPLAAPVFGPQNVADLSKLLRERENVELLISRIEEMAAENDKASADAAGGQG